MSGPYDDIINLPHPTSQRHPRMPIHDRAAIFSPFAALSGHGTAIAETARLTERRIELDEDTRAELDRRQAILLEHMDEQPEITVTWFQPESCISFNFSSFIISKFFGATKLPFPCTVFINSSCSSSS